MTGEQAIRWTGRGRELLDLAADGASTSEVESDLAAQRWITWAARRYGAVLPMPVARRCAAAGEAPNA